MVLSSFHPTMVRIKRYVFVEFLHLSGFHPTMVRIKRVSWRDGICVYGFHPTMVRIKRASRRCSNKTIYVSIPQWFGSNMEGSLVVARRLCVSIPQWFGSNFNLLPDSLSALSVSIPQWFGSNNITYQLSKMLHCCFHPTMVRIKLKAKIIPPF